ncbi:MAG: hypothetical protein AAGB04_25295 [Pseudomonadota bacterium]
MKALHDLESIGSRADSIEALSYILAAWEEGSDAGLATELLAYAALYTALADLVDKFGEDNVASLVEGLSGRVRSGEFTLFETCQ